MLGWCSEGTTGGTIKEIHALASTSRHTRADKMLTEVRLRLRTTSKVLTMVSPVTTMNAQTNADTLVSGVGGSPPMPFTPRDPAMWSQRNSGHAPRSGIAERPPVATWKTGSAEPSNAGDPTPSGHRKLLVGISGGLKAIRATARLFLAWSRFLLTLPGRTRFTIRAVRLLLSTQLLADSRRA